MVEAVRLYEQIINLIYTILSFWFSSELNIIQNTRMWDTSIPSHVTISSVTCLDF